MASRTSSPLLHPEEHQIDLFALMTALGDPVRRSIVVTLGEHPEVACGTFDLPVAKSALSRHFRTLRECGLIRQRDEGTRRLNALRREELDRRFPGLLDLVLREGADCAVGVLVEATGGADP
ncbi:helix-turn-helix transcriptional regulator [Saccharopolyspora taberi]|uniref:Helix-turn-helix domain-containing protein n=1 Tax=Saccharopolyspora taberi TaxID=60895 RepID=A0ABN3V922_9PSEU